MSKTKKSGSVHRRKPTKEALARQLQVLRRQHSAARDTAKEFLSTIRVIGEVLGKDLEESVLDAAKRVRRAADRAESNRSAEEAKTRIAVRARADESTSVAAIEFAEWAAKLQRIIAIANRVANEYRMP